jgi:hypothetical protein
MKAQYICYGELKPANVIKYQNGTIDGTYYEKGWVIN